MLSEEVKQFCSEIQYRQDDFIKILKKLSEESFALKKISNIKSQDSISKQYLLGSGGQAYVVLGEQTQTKEEVAIKFSKSCKQVYDEMTRELDVIKKIKTFDQIAEVKHNFFLEVEQICIQIIELCSKSLMQEIEEMRSKNQQYSYKQALSILFFSINVLCEIHCNDIIHFDIKPSNILITEEGKYKLADFGHSKKLKSNESHTKSYGGGSPYFNSPEQYKANCSNSSDNNISMRRFTDIFSMGVSMLEVIGVKIDFQIFNALQQNKTDSIDDKFQLQYLNIYTFIKYYMIQDQYNQRFSAIRLRQIFLKEFESEIKFDEEIQRLQRSIIKYESDCSEEKNQNYLAYLYYFKSQVVELKIAEESILKSKQYVQKSNLKGKIEESIFLEQYGIILQKRCRFDKSEKKLIKSQQILIQHVNNTKNIEVGFLYYKLYEFYRQIRNNQKQLNCCEKGLEIFEFNFQHKHPFISNFLNGLGSSYFELNDFKKGQEFYEKALNIRNQLYRDNHPSIYASLNNIGRCYLIQKNYQKALENFMESQKIQQALYNCNHQDLAITLLNISIAYGNLENKQKNLEYLKEALEMYEALFKGNHPEIAFTLNNLGCYYFNQQDYQESLYYYQRALEMVEALYKFNHKWKAEYLENVGDTYQQLGELKQANEYLTRSKAMFAELKKQ